MQTRTFLLWISLGLTACADEVETLAPRVGEPDIHANSDAGPVFDSGPQTDVQPENDAASDSASPDLGTDGMVLDIGPDAAPPECMPGETSAAPCLQDGLCAGSEARCTAGQWVCVYPDGYTEDEQDCDGADNDCDGTIDEAFPDVSTPCDTDDLDLCALGLWRCNDGKDGLICVDDEPVFETCNGVDDDCDGTTDEQVADPPLAARQEGICAGSTQVCVGADGWIEPEYSSLDGYEEAEVTCDGVDNDCDGRTDVGLFPPPSDQQDGVCSGAQKTCGGQEGWLEPDYAAQMGYEADELTCDGVDNDCDGLTDEAVPVPPCQFEIGVCAQPSALPTCGGIDGFSDCEYGPDYEANELDTCDALDNDCDGSIDEGEQCPDGFRSVRVEVGEYTRGSPENEPRRGADEPQHQVTLTHELIVRVTEMTQAEWVAISGHPNPSARISANRPVEQVSWLEAIQFLNALSLADGLVPCYEIAGADVVWSNGFDCPGWRLPTEAEWAYLARGGTSGMHYGLDLGLELNDVAWNRANTDSTQPVAQLIPNAYGLYDVLGNVSEWTWDLYGPYPDGPVIDPIGADEGPRRVARGGHYNGSPTLLRVANRLPFTPVSRIHDLGFRAVRTIGGAQ